MRRPDYGPPQGDQSFMNKVLQMMFTPWEGNPFQRPRAEMLPLPPSDEELRRTRLYHSGEGNDWDNYIDPHMYELIAEEFNRKWRENNLQPPTQPPQGPTGPRRWY